MALKKTISIGDLKSANKKSQAARDAEKSGTGTTTQKG